MSRKKTFNEFKDDFLNRWGSDKYVFDEGTFIDSHTPMRVICLEHGEFWATPKNLLHHECRRCSYKKRALKNELTTEDFINKAKIIHGNKYDYSDVEYKGTKTPVVIKCLKHGYFSQKPNDHLSGKGCPMCNESHLERKVKDILENNNIDYIYQYKPEWLNKQSIDFYIPHKNLGIECQGKQHFGYGGWSKSFDFDKLYQLDNIKNELCKMNNLNLIYIVDDDMISKVPDFIKYKEDIIKISNLEECIQKIEY